MVMTTALKWENTLETAQDSFFQDELRTHSMTAHFKDRSVSEHVSKLWEVF